MTQDKLHFLVWLPRIDSARFGECGVRADDVTDGIHDAVEQIAAGWRGRPAPSVRLLPDELPYDQLPAPTRALSARAIPLGVNENELAPVYLDFDADPHFVAFADSESGKTNLLRVLLRGLTDRYSPKEAKIVLVDYRRTLLGVVSQDHLMGYAASARQLDEFVTGVRNVMNRRLPGPDVTQEQLKTRSWWTGSECFVVVDDYDLVATQSGNPLQPLAEFLPQAKDVGLHLIAVRRSGGSARALYDPILGKLRELAVPGLVMSGSKDEGALVGTVRPTQLPPGRGNLVTRRRGTELTQIAWIAPD
jgi:S-DNA-T family DNA segregation ATPase FtsK/SpoIIIE